jgi:hypothetical protein
MRASVPRFSRPSPGSLQRFHLYRPELRSRFQGCPPLCSL